MAKKKEEAHHGGAWKVAYADFVTAMMALFMVLWICAQDKQIMLATSKYFKQPFNALTDRSVGIMQGKDGGSIGKDQTRDTATAANLAFLNALASELSRMLNVRDMESDAAPVDFQVTSDNLRITLFDRSARPVFKKASPELTEWGRQSMQSLSWIIERNGLKVYIEGHAATNKQSAPEYGPWELTADRANAARRLLEQYAVDPKKIERVTGYGNTQPLRGAEPDSDSNDRIVLSLSARR